MGSNSAIEWTHHTFNPWRGCTKISDGCKNCYAETQSKRNPGVLGVWGPHGTREIAAESYWRQPLAWDIAAAAAGERHRVFCASLADVFEADDTIPAASREAVDAARLRLFMLIDSTPHLDWLLLTKCPENILPTLDRISRGNGDAWNLERHMPNVRIGTSVEDQEQADKRIPELLKVPAKVRFLSMEPLLGPVDLSRWLVGWNRALDHSMIPHTLSPIDTDINQMRCFDCGWTSAGCPIDWVIVGGESGPNARPMHPDWPRSIRDQCAAAGVPFFFKQWGEWAFQPDYLSNWNGRPESHRWDEADNCLSFKVGKKKAGRLLDGREHNEMPEFAR